MSTPAESPLTRRLTPVAADLLRSIRASGFPGWSAMGVEQARAAIVQMKLFAGPQEPVGRVEQIHIAGRDGSDLRGNFTYQIRPNPCQPLSTCTVGVG